MTPPGQAPRSCITALIVWALAITCLAWPAAAAAHDAHEEQHDALFDLSLEELLDLEVSGASRKSQTLAETAAAAFVISSRDLLRSGATSIPEALRMVPGMHVARVDGNVVAVTARGSNGRYANKLLVMIDGRALYTPAFSGVYWDIQDIPMADIERIEVIRGPGSSLWGTNAVNGIVNVVTRRASDAEGGLAMASAGNKLDHDVTLRWGEEINPELAYRISALAEQRDGNRDLMGNDTNDDLEQLRLNSRVDWTPTQSDELMFSADLYDVESGASFAVQQFSAPFEKVRVDDTEDSTGGSLLGRWKHSYDGGSATAGHAYVDFMDRDGPRWGERKLTYELDLQHHQTFSERHDLIFGGTVRYHDVELTGSEAQQMDERFFNNLIVSVFVENDYKVLNDKLSLILGAKLEHNDLSDEDVEFMPSARFLYRFSDETQVWGAVTQAVRTPNLAEQSARVTVSLDEFFPGLAPFTQLPVFIDLAANENMKSEDITAFELGVRSQVTPALNLDLALFYNDYENLRWPKFGGLSCVPHDVPFPACLADAEYLLLLTELANASEADAIGAELAVNWQATEWWQLQGAFTYMDYDLEPDDDIRNGPDWDISRALSLQSRFDLSDSLQLDFWLRYADEIEYYDIDEYWTLDVRFAWQINDQLEFALFGDNLLESAHQEYQSEQRELVPVEIERSWRVELRYNF
ncbi:MAG: TonB-dependent receptor [Halieaceae bacterium]|nr:TonB-dependent receptor [Halieaceae bacterium]